VAEGSVILGAEVCDNRGRGVLRMDESSACLIAHRRRDVSAGVKNSPDIHDLIADDVEHQVGEANQRADAEARNLELVGESQAARVR